MKKRNLSGLTFALMLAVFTIIGLNTSVRVTKDNQYVVSVVKDTKNETANFSSNEQLNIKTTLTQPQALAYMVSSLS